MKSLYSEFITAYRNYVLSLTSDIHNRAAYDASMKHHKIDPCIAGGIGQSIAGLGGGLYAAESVAANNAKIDASRKYYQNEVISSSISLSCDETRLLDLFNRIVQIISDEPILQNKRNEILQKVLFINIFDNLIFLLMFGIHLFLKVNGAAIYPAAPSFFIIILQRDTRQRAPSQPRK